MVAPRRLVVLAAVGGLILTGVPALAAGPPSAGRDAVPQTEALAERLGGSVRLVDGRVRSVLGTGGAPLTGPSADAAAAALEYLRRHADAFGLTPADVRGLRIVSDTATTPGGTRTVVVRQTDAGREVDGSALVVTLDRHGAVRAVTANTYPGAQAGRLTGAAPASAAVAAVTRAAGVVGRSARLLGSRDGVLVLDNGERADATARLVTHPAPGGARPAWLVEVELDDATWPRAVVDAVTLQVLETRNLVHADGPRGRVFTQQHPLVAGAAQSVVPFTGTNGSWVDGDTTAGNNAIAYEDTEGDNTSGDGDSHMPVAADEHFEHTYSDALFTSGGTDRVTDQDAVITQAFYYVNTLHETYYRLGFTEATRNFQVDNFGRGGSGGDRAIVEVDDQFDNAAVGCNANMATPSDGSSPRLQLFVGRASCANRDMHRAMNGDTVTHEFGHGLSNRLVGGGNLGSGAQTGALGEGWSDALANVRWDDPVYGEYNNGNVATGIRGVAYDTSTLTYGDFSPAAGVHANGRIWATVMWDAKEVLEARYADGKDRHEQLLISGMLATTTSPTFLDARDGYLAANASEHGAADWCPLWRAFAAVGMGADATSPTQGTVLRGTRLPSECRPTARTGGPYTTPEGTDVLLDASSSTAGSHPSAEGPLAFAWDLDVDGRFDDATGATVVFDDVGQDGYHTVAVQVTNPAGARSVEITLITVENVAPAVELALSPTGDESAPVQLVATATDPGWLDAPSVTVDWGVGAGPQPLAGSLEGGRPDAVLTAAAPHHYGDDGSYTVEVCASDDDTRTCRTATTDIANVGPTAAVDLSAATSWNGLQVLLATAGRPLSLAGRSTDPGSDDLTTTWTFGDGATESRTWLVDPPQADPATSPTVQPRDVTHETSHTWSAACVHELGLTSADDDGGAAAEAATVVVQGPASAAQGAGWWYGQARPGQRNANDLTDPEMACRLQVAALLSSVFSEVRDVSSHELAHAALKDDGHDQSKTTSLERNLLAAWLNFAHGAFTLDGAVPAYDGDDGSGAGSPATTFGELAQRAEALRQDPSATPSRRAAMAAALEHANGGA